MIQDYDRQVKDLTQLAKTHNWKVQEIFTEKISGAKKNDERVELNNLLAYVRAHNINKVLVTELSRLGRDTLQVLNAIEMLNDAGVSLYIMNYNIETLDTNLTDEEARIIIFDAILMAVRVEDIKVAYEKLETYKKGGKSSEEADEGEAD